MRETGRGAPARSATADREIVISRVISGPRELVFEAFTEVRHLSRWWGPEGFTTTTRAFEFRVGGEWDFVMHGPDGTDYQEWISWTEIAPPERIALLHGESRGAPNAFESVLTFAPNGAATRIEMRTVFPTKELRDEAVERYHAIEGGQQTLSNLAAYVTEIVRKGWMARKEPGGSGGTGPLGADGGTIPQVERPSRWRRWPEIIAAASVPDTLDHLAEVIEGLNRAPIIMGHSFGGTFTQLLVNRGLGAAAVVIGSAPPEGVRVNPPSQIKSLFPVLKNPANRHRAVGFTKEQFHYAFANTVSREESDAAYDLLHIPAPGNWVWAYGLIANWKPGHQETWVDYDMDDRAPLLFIIGGKDHLMPPSVIRSNAKKYRNSEATTETYEFPDRSHFTGVEPGWEQVADYALEWATSHARAPQGRSSADSGRGPSGKPSPRNRLRAIC